MWPSRLRPESQRRGAPPRRTFRKNSQQSGSSDSCNFCAVARLPKTAHLIKLGRGTAPWPLRNLQEFPAPIGLKKFLQFLRGGASSQDSEPYQTMAVAQRQGLSEISGIPGTNRAQEIPAISALWRVLSHQRNLPNYGCGTAPWPLRNFRNSWHQSGSRNS